MKLSLEGRRAMVTGASSGLGAHFATVLRRLGQPGDLDAPLLLLASPASGFMTGSIVVVDGGHMAISL